MEILEKTIKLDEGFRDHIYLDSKGNPTGGWGHHFCVGSRLPIEACKLLLKQDMADAVNEFHKLPRELRHKLNEARRRVIVCMIFNMGLSSLMGFKKMWTAIEKEDWVSAHTEMLESKWHSEVGMRAERLARIMMSGTWPDTE